MTCHSEEARERQRAYNRAYHAKHREEEAAYREKNREDARAYARAYRANHREELLAKSRAYYAEHRTQHRARDVGRIYGITLEQAADLEQAQGGRCAVCQKQLPGSSRNVHIDHDHASGVVRGILCRECNRALGALKDSPTSAASALIYLAVHGQRLAPQDFDAFVAAYERACSTTTNTQGPQNGGATTRPGG